MNTGVRPWVEGEPSTTVERVVEAATDWPAVSLAPHPYDGVEFRLGDHEVGHVHHGWESVHVNYPRRMRDALIAAGRTSAHPYFSDSGWTSRRLSTPDDVEAALWLLRVAYLYRSLTRRERPEGRAVLESVDVAAELDELGVGEAVHGIFDGVVDGRSLRAVGP